VKDKLISELQAMKAMLNHSEIKLILAVNYRVFS